MTRMTRLLLSLLFCLVLVGTPLVLADDPQAQGQTESQDTSVTGELKSVDVDAKTITVTTSEGTDMEFVYNDSTEIMGAQGTIEGLSANAGSKVKVSCKEEDGKNVATKVKVKEARTDS
ncbi:MAG TPA: hypothetical protein PLP42_07780 [Acidobacteriota bacterium]|nr:hypothetical protein [Acidobacteriota bacterium]